MNDMVEEEADMGTYSAANIDIDAIASAKSLGDAMRLLAPQLEGLPRRSRGKYGKRKHLSAEEKAELTRRRNRENARSTRMRRKMYIKHLQDVAEKLQKRHEEINAKMAKPPPDGYSRQREAARCFFLMRGNCVTNIDKWLQILSPQIILTLPVTPYRTFPASELQNTIRRIIGISSIANDCASLQSFLSDLGQRRALTKEDYLSSGEKEKTSYRQRDTLSSRHLSYNTPLLTFQVDQGSIVHSNNAYLCQWTAKISCIEDDEIQVSISHTGMARILFF
uniref:BZIP domain-containing protein n=1 Tax=Aureoumbra lagunensis TaxID=44058 RepID=A0A7S3JWD2_9STRA